MAEPRYSAPPPPMMGMRGLRGGFVKPKDFKGTLRRLWLMVKGESKGLIPVVFLSALISVTAMVTPLLTGRIIDAVGLGNLPAQLLAALLAVYAADGLNRLLQGYIMSGVSQKIVLFVRKSLFKKLSQLPISFFDTRQHGDLMSRLTNDIDNISTTISDSLVHLITLVFTLVGVLIIMLGTNLYLSLAVLITAPLIYLLTKTITKRTRVLFREQQNALGALNGHVEETISGLMVVKAYAKEADVIEDFEEINEKLYEVGKKSLIWSGYLMPIMNVINNIGFISVAVVGGSMAASELITVGVVSSFLLYSRQFARPLNEIANIYNLLQSAVAGAERIFELFDQQDEPDDKPDSLPIASLRGDVVFEDVCFGYKKDEPVLERLSFSVPAGTKVAVVGSTGAGKTTIISLLARFYDVGSGRILLDGRDLRDYRMRELRACFGIVLQDTALFNRTLIENIRYGRQGASDEEIIGAAKAAGAHTFISRLPGGYQTVIGDGGKNLSQGERQLITIARAMLADAPILILDEATSSVDTHTERRIQKALLSLTSGRTSFIIAHRLSTIRNADMIIVIENGRIAEKGTHEELLAARGIYHDMYRLQTS